MKVEFTPSQCRKCRNLAEFIERKLFDSIRKEPRIDNMDWLRDMMDAHDALATALEKREEND